MKALALTAHNTFEVQQVPDPVPGPNEVLVRVAACGICGSDVHGMDGSTGRRRPPIIMGHEAAGTIEALGSNVSAWECGARVTFDSTVYCGHCDYCRVGRVNLCEQRRVLGVSCEEYRQHGALAEYVAVPQHILYRLPGNLTFEHAAMVEPVSIAVHAVSRAHVGQVDTALVVGSGMIGLLLVQMLRVRGCHSIIAVDIDALRLAVAGRFGAHVLLNANEVNVPEAVREHTGGHGADAAFEVVGTSAALMNAIQSVRKGGSVTLVGNLASMAEVPLQVIVTRELSLYGSCASCGEYPECLRLMAGGAIDVAPLISAVAPLDEGAQWFARLYNKEPGLMKVILRP